MQKPFCSYASRSLQLLIAGLSLCITQNYTYAQGHRCDDSKDYKVEFDYKGHQKEREIAYQFFKDQYPYFATYTQEQKFLIGIALCDIDHDGNDEIIAYLTDPGYCGSAGCSFEIIKVNKNTNKFNSFEGCGSDGRSLSLHVREPIMIMKHSILGFRDIVFEPEYEGALWQWNGKGYELTKIQSENAQIPSADAQKNTK